MISYEKGGNIIIDRGLPDVPAVDIDDFKNRSYEHFCKVTAPEIIRETYVPALNEYLKTSGIRVRLVSVEVRRKRPLVIGYCKQMSSQEALRENDTCVTDCIYGKFALESTGENAVTDYTPLNEAAEEVELCSIPYVEDGLVIYDRYDNIAKIFKKHAYNFIQQVELCPSISFGSKKEVTIRCKSGKSLIFYLNSKGQLRVQLSKKSHKPFVALACYRGQREILEMGGKAPAFKEVRTAIRDSIHYYGLTRCNESMYFDTNGVTKYSVEHHENFNRKEKEKERAALDRGEDYTPGQLEEVNPGDIKDIVNNQFLAKDSMFYAEGLRGALNQYLSLYRAEGLVTAYDVKDAAGNVVVPADTMLTKEDIKRIYDHNIFYFHVIQERPTSVYLTHPIIIRRIPKGTRNRSFLKAYLPEEKGMYISQDYTLDATQSVVFPKNTELNEVIWQFLREVKYVGEIWVKNSPSSDNRFKLYLDREIYSNFFKPTGDTNYEEWEYVGPMGLGGNPDTFTYGDMLALYSFLPQVLNNLHVGWLPDADACFLKHFTTVDQMFGKALRDASQLFFRTYTHYLKDFKVKPEYLLKADEFDKRTWQMFGLFVRKLNESKCLELVDEKVYINPLAYASAKRKANVYVGNKHAISDEQRRMALTSYGRFDAYEVPQSGRLGIVNYLTTTCKQTEEGLPLVCYYPLENGRVRFDKPTWLDTMQEAQHIITDIGVLKLEGDRITNDPNDIVNCRVPSVGKAKSTIEPQKIADVQYVNADPDCTLGFTCGSIPFSCSNDAIRATFAVAQIKEAKAIQHAERAGVTTTLMTKMEKQNNPFCIRANEDGVIIRDTQTTTTNRSVRLECVTGDTSFNHDRKQINYCSWADLGGSESLTRLRLNQKVGIPYKKGDILCTSEFVDKDGHIRLGMETLVAYISDGCNYEDGVSIFPPFAERATSISLHSEVVYSGPYKPEFTPDKGRYYKRDNIIYINRKGRSTPSKHTLTESGYVYEQILTKRDKLYTLTIKFLSVEPAAKGDKFSDRDGNKGVVAHVYDNDTVYTLGNGCPIEVLRNPLGVATRLNIGQIRECRLGWVYKILNTTVELDNFSHDAEDIDLLVEYVYDLANANSIGEVTSKYAGKLPKALLDLGSERFEEAQKWRGTFDTEGACTIYINGRKQPVKAYAGWVYMLKLVQEVRSKISYRAGEAEGERYMSKTNSPTKGRKSNGGQRFGSMEVAAYCAYGAEAWLNEMFKYRSDDGSGRLAFAMDKYYGSKEYYDEMTQRRSVTEMVTLLAGLGVDMTASDGELIDALTLQDAGVLAYPRLNTLREEMSFQTFNKPRKPREKLKEDVFSMEFFTEEEMENVPLPPEIVTHEDLISGSENARHWLKVILQNDELVDKYLGTYRRKAGL